MSNKENLLSATTRNQKKQAQDQRNVKDRDMKKSSKQDKGYCLRTTSAYGVYSHDMDFQRRSSIELLYENFTCYL